MEVKLPREGLRSIQWRIIHMIGVTLNVITMTMVSPSAWLHLMIWIIMQDVHLKWEFLIQIQDNSQTLIIDTYGRAAAHTA